MPTSLSALIPTLYAAQDIVSRELVGFIPSVTLDPSSARAAVGDFVDIPIVPAQASRSIVPGVDSPHDGNHVITKTQISVTKSKAVPITWDGETQRRAENGIGVNALLVNQFSQAMRTLVNEIEADLSGEYATSSRAYGTAGTAPFAIANDFTDVSMTRKILADNGAPGDLRMVINTLGGGNIRGRQANSQVQGGTDLLRQGVILDINGVPIRESAAIRRHIKGTGAGATTNAAGYAVGATVITLASAGTGTIVAGDIVQFAGDAERYIVSAGDTDVSNGGTITIAAPGLRQALPAAATAITVINTSSRMMMFSQSAILLATRQPAAPSQGDKAIDVYALTDPVSGITFEVRLYPAYRQFTIEVGLAWAFKNIKPEHTAVLIGE